MLIQKVNILFLLISAAFGGFPPPVFASVRKRALKVRNIDR